VPIKPEILRLYGQYSVELAQSLKEGATLEPEQQLFIENHLLILQLALALSKHCETKRLRPVRGA